MGNNQLILDFNYRPCFGKEDFMVNKCNEEAVAMVDSWPSWPFFAMLIYGTEGCGKTHLAHVFAHNVFKKSKQETRFIKAKDITLENIENLGSTLVVEDLSVDIDNEALFHLYNLTRSQNGFILFTSSEAPARLKFNLPDLQSRLNAVPAVKIKEPDDELLSALIIKQFSDRQILVAPEVLNYIIKNMERSFPFARKLVKEIDTLSLSQKKHISISLVKQALETLNNSSQGELF